MLARSHSSAVPGGRARDPGALSRWRRPQQDQGRYLGAPLDPCTPGELLAKLVAKKRVQTNYILPFPVGEYDAAPSA